MLAHTLKSILTLVPEALPMVKKASVDQEFPLDNKDSCIATALQMKYFEKVAFAPVDFTTLEKVAKAVNLYGVGAQVADLTNLMVKAASNQRSQKELMAKDNYMLKEASYVGDLSTMSVSQRSEGAEYLYDLAKQYEVTPHDSVVLYSGHAGFDKAAAVKSLTVRYNETKNMDFVKVANVIAKAVDDKDSRLTEPENLVKIANFISRTDEKLGLQFHGFDFFKESFHVKEAAFNSSVSIKLCNQQVPYTKIAAVGKDRIAEYIGKDVADEFERGPENFKTVAETLPQDLQRVLMDLTKNV
jgi:hypothetical protein